MTKFPVECVEFTKKDLKRLSSEELSFFVFAGHILNEFVLLQKIMMACHNRGSRLLKQKRRSYRWKAHLDANATQTLIIQRLALGKIYEAKIFLEHYALKKAWFKEITRSLRSEGKIALRKLKSAHARDKKQREKNPFSVARNKFAFHYYIPPVITLAAKDEHIPDVFRFYLTEHLGSALHHGNEETITRIYLGMIALKRKGPKIGFSRTYGLILHRQRLIQNLLAECIYALIFPNDKSKHVKVKNRTLVLSEKSNIHNYEIPWFIPKA